MTNNILIINGAIRINGNTDTIFKGAAKTDANLTLLNLREKKVLNCIACYQCIGESKYSQDDDMTEIRKSIESADLVIFASPLYWGGVTGLMKTFIDRLFFYYSTNKSLISGKKALIITTMNQEGIQKEVASLIEFYKSLFKCLEIKLIDAVFFSNIMEKKAALNKPEYLEQAYSLGKKIFLY